MEKPLIANEDIVTKALRAILDAFEKNDIPKLEAGIACRAVLDQLAKEGLDIRSEPTHS